MLHHAKWDPFECENAQPNKACIAKLPSVDKHENKAWIMLSDTILLSLTSFNYLTF
jgi:hypothetical protein